MIKLKVKFTFMSRSQMLIHLGSYNLYRFSIHTIDRTDKTLCQIRVSLSFFVIKYCHRDISENSRAGGEEIE